MISDDIIEDLIIKFCREVNPELNPIDFEYYFENDLIIIEFSVQLYQLSFDISFSVIKSLVNNNYPQRSISY